MPPGRAVRASRWVAAAACGAWLFVMMGCGHNGWTDADRAAVAAMGAAAEAHALASRVASEAEVEDGVALAEAARGAVDAARTAQAEARKWTERGSVDAALLAEAFRMTDAAWKRAAEAAEAALLVWDVALSVAAPNVGSGDLAALATADSVWAWDAAGLAAMVWDSAAWVMGYRAEAAREEFEHLYHPWVDSAEAARALAEWKALYAASGAAYESAEATKDSAAVAAYEAAQDRVMTTEKDAADSAADAAGQRAVEAVMDEREAVLERARRELFQTRRGTPARKAAEAAYEEVRAAYSLDLSVLSAARARAVEAHGGGAFYAAVAARDAARDTAEVTKDSAAEAAYESALAAMYPWGAVEPRTQVQLAAMKAREAVDAVSAAAEAWAAVSISHPRVGS